MLWNIFDFFKNYKDKFNINNSLVKYSFLFGIILDKLDIKENGGVVIDNYHYNFALGIFLLSLICLLNLINVIAYLIVSNLFNTNSINNKYPKFN